MLKHFQVPEYFRDDLFSIMGEHKRPPFRWFAIGPQRSGSTVHIDPLLTSAWNTSLQGHKRWVLFPQETPKHIVKGKNYLRDDQEYEAISYFAECLPKIKEDGKGKIQTIEFIQHPGETVFVPGGWWHAVVNCDNTMAVTQNFVSYTNFETVWRTLRVERKKFSCKFLARLKEEHPKLYEVAIQMNKQDNFVMYNERTILKRNQDSDFGDVVVKKNNSSTNSSTSSSSSSSSSSESRSASEK